MTTTIYVRWLGPQGWTYAVYKLQDDQPAQHTVLPIEMEPLAKAYPDMDDKSPDGLEGKRDAITQALQVKYPGARVEFVEIPQARR